MKSDELLKIKNTLLVKTKEQDKLLGKKENLLEQLKELGCSSFPEAEIKIEELEIEIKKKEKIFHDSLETFKEKYGNLL